MSLELLKDHLKDANKCLDIGSGTGYMSLAMKLLANNQTLIFGIDHIYELSQIAQAAIEEAGFYEVIEDYNIVFITADGTNGLRRHKPLDCINVGISFESPPLHLLSQLRNNGRLVVPIGKYKQVLRVIDKIDDTHYSEKEYDIDLVFPLAMTLKEQCLDCAQRYESARQANSNVNIKDILYPKKVQDDL